MLNRNQPPRPALSIGMLLIVTALVCLLYLLPHEMLTVLTVWTLTSFPIGVLIGHCVLNEE